MAENRKGKHRRLPLPLILTLITFIISLVTSLLVLLGVLVLYRLGLFRTQYIAVAPLVTLLAFSAAVSTVMTMFFSRHTVGPIQEMMEAVDKVAGGDYSVRITEEEGPDKVRQLCGKFNHMAEELSSVEMLRSDFISNFSHEFKTPIVSIRGFAKALKWENVPESERDEYLNIIIAESDRLTDLATSVLTLSRVENQTILSDVTEFDLAEQLRRAVVLLDEKWSLKKLDMDFDAEETTLRGNADMLNQVWINLLDNAIKFSPEFGTIRIRLRRRDGRAVVTIADDGPGMEKETVAHIFDRFYQGDRSHTVRGNGLGLSIARRIVVLHAGEISCESAPGRGSLFTVVLPAV